MAEEPQRALPHEPLKVNDEERIRAIIRAAESHAIQEQNRWDKYVKLFRDGHFDGKPGEPTVRVTANMTFAYISMMMAMLYASNPSVEVEPREDVSGPSDAQLNVLVQMGVIPSLADGRVLFAEALERVLEYSYEEGRSKIHNQSVLFETLTRGMGISKESFDDDRGLDRCDSLRRDEVYIDPHARYDLSQGFYVVQTCILPIEQARAFFAKKGVTQGIEPNMEIGNTTGLASEEAKTKVASIGGVKDLFKFYEIWTRDGKERRLDYRAYQKDEYIHRDSWPFGLDSDEFPYSILVFHNQFGTISDAFSDRHTVDGLRTLVEDVIEFGHKHTRRSIAKKIMYDKGAIDPATLDKIMSSKDMLPIGVDLKNKGLNDVLKLVEFNSGSDASMEMAQTFRELMQDIDGQAELKRIADTDMTATQADILEKYGQVRLAKRQRSVDDFLTQQCRHRAQIVRQLIPPEKVARICGERAGLLWRVLASDPEDLVSEYSIGISAGSTGERAKQKKLERMERGYNRAAAINQAMMAPVYDLVRINNEIWKEDGERRPEKYLTAQTPSTQPPMPGMQPPPPGPTAPPMQPEPMPTPAPGGVG